MGLPRSAEKAAKRPEHYEDLLSRPIGADLDDPNSYQDWEFDHGTKPRFYIQGFLWFLRQTHLTVNGVANFREEAADFVEDATSWDEMPGWTQERQPVARQQLNAARNHKPLRFQKAATILVACELAAAERLERYGECGEIHSPQDIYRHMKIVPACWNINDFNPPFLEELRSQPENYQGLQRYIAQDKQVLEDLANGHSVSFDTAKDIKEWLDKKTDMDVGQVRARPGKKMLGRKSASLNERIALG